MLTSLRLVAGGVVISALALLGGPPLASADPWEGCTAHSLEEKTVRVFPRTPTPGGPDGSSSELQCGNRYYGFQRIAAEWAAIPNWAPAADAAITRALTTGRPPVRDPRSGNWTYSATGVVVVAGPRGLIIDAQPAAS